MKPLLVYLIILGGAGISSIAILSTDIDLTLQKFGTWNSVEEFATTSENPNNLGFMCQCDADGDGTFSESECNLEIECDADGDGAFTVEECDEMPMDGEEIPSRPVMPDGFMGNNAEKLCMWEATIGTYGSAFALNQYYLGEGCDARFWQEQSLLKNNVWPAEYRPEYKFNEIFGTSISIDLQKPGYGKSDSGLTPYQMKMKVISDLEEIDDASTKTTKKIKKALKYLKENTEQSLWIDESHLGENGLLKFYLNEHLAAFELERIIFDSRENPQIVDKIKQILVYITESNKIIVKTAHNDLALFIKQNNIKNEKFDIATESLEKADEYFEESKEAVEKKFPIIFKLQFHKALTMYGKAWTFTQKAMDEVDYVKDLEPTLLDALWATKNGAASDLERLAGHSTAALLNAAHDEVDYRYDVVETIKMTQDSILNEDHLGLTAKFLEENNFGSPLCPK